LAYFVSVYPSETKQKMTDDTPHPLARMATISKPSFWIFIGACMVLFVVNKFITPDTGDQTSNKLNNIIIIACAFIALLLNLVGGVIKNERLGRIFNKICLAFEILSITFIIVRMIYM
jgi:hypothetical protein